MNTSKNNLLTRWPPFLIPLILISLTVLCRLIPGLRIIDDAYITYRYARNILSGHGFTYNIGQPIQGTTTPLYTFILALIGWLTEGSAAPFPRIAVTINTLADAATVFLVYRIGRKVKFPLAGILTGLYWAAAPFSVTFAIGGLETSFFEFLLTASVYYYLVERRYLAFLLASFAVLTRPDGVLLAGLLIIDYSRRQIKNSGWLNTTSFTHLSRAALTFGLPLMIWISFAWWKFGSPIPHSVTAKSQAYLLPADAALTRLLQHFATPFLGNLTLGRLGIALGLIMYPFLVVLAVRKLNHDHPKILPWAMYPLVYFCAFALANPLIFRWYLTPPLLPFVFFVFLGLSDLLQTLSKAVHSAVLPEANQQHLRQLMNLLMFIPLLLTLKGWTLAPDHGPRRPAPRMAFIKLELIYHQAADLINERTADFESDPSLQSPVLAAGDVGVLGYETKLEILDLVGLNSPEPLDYYPLEPSLYTINYAVPPQLVLDERPDYLIILEVYGRKGLLERDDFWANYRLIEKISTDLYGSEGMLIFQRSDSGP